MYMHICMYVYICRYLLHLECKPEYVISSDFLAAFRPKIAHYREVLIDWMMGVGRHFHLLQETLFLSVDILDRYLQVITHDIHT